MLKICIYICLNLRIHDKNNEEINILVNNENGYFLNVCTI